jgi:hypothetical protein
MAQIGKNISGLRPLAGRDADSQRLATLLAPKPHGIAPQMLAPAPIVSPAPALPQASPSVSDISTCP